MRSILLFLLVLQAFCFKLHAQSQRPEITLIHGNKYFVYPLQYQWEEQQNDAKRFFLKLGEVPPITEKLPDGNYVMNGSPYPGKKKIATITGASFHMVNSTLEGQVFYFDEKGDTIGSVQYKNGMKEGLSITYNKDYKNGIQNKIYYRNSLPFGEEIWYWPNGAVYSHLWNGEQKPTGAFTRQASFYAYKYQSFHENQQKKIEFFSDTSVAVYNEPLRLYDFEELFKPEENFSDLLGGDHPRNIGFKVYYPNGQPLGNFYNFVVFNDYLNDWMEAAAVDFDTLFHLNGRVAVIKENLADTFKIRHFVYHCYDDSGERVKDKYFIKDSESETHLHKEITFLKNGKSYCSYFTQEHFQRYDDHAIPGDSLILWRVSKNEKEYDSTYIWSGHDRLLQKYLHGNRRKNFCIQNSGKPFYCVDTIEEGELKIIAHFRDLEFRTGKEEEGFYTEGAAFQGIDYEYLNDTCFLSQLESQMLDSMFFHYQNKPYTGVLNLYKVSERGLFKATKKQLYYDYGEKDWWRSDQVSKIEIVNGSITKISFYDLVEEDRHFDYETNIKNHLVHGKETGFSRKKIIFQRAYENGYLEGESVNYWGKKIESKRYYKHGLLEGEWTEYNYEGKCIFRTNYIAGEEDGAEIYYHDNGNIASSCFYKNGVHHGPYCRLSESGDTLEKKNYIYELLDGAYYRKDENFNDKPIYTYWMQADSGRMKTLVVKDVVGNIRMQVAAEKCEVMTEYEYFDGVLTNLWHLPYFTGNVKQFYPNGKVYFEGNISHKYVQNTYGGAWEKFPVGTWAYYYSDGRTRKKINFIASTYEEYYPSGTLKYKGKWSELAFEKDCESEFLEDESDVYYDYFINANGDTLVKNGNGKIELFYSNGLLHFEGELKDGIKTNIWKEYNKKGTLICVGKYEEGLPEGRWLKGDLTGINYLAENCFESAEAQQIQQQEEINNIEIEEIFYSKGNIVNQKTYQVKRKK